VQLAFFTHLYEATDLSIPSADWNPLVNWSARWMRRFTTEPLTGADLDEDGMEGSAWAGGTISSKSWDLWKLNIWLQQQSIFQRIHLSNVVQGTTGWHIPEILSAISIFYTFVWSNGFVNTIGRVCKTETDPENLSINIFKNTTIKKD
jgi:hypothetical protein